MREKKKEAWSQKKVQQQRHHIVRKKTIRDIAKLWADDDQEYAIMCHHANTMMKKNDHSSNSATYDDVRMLFISLELEKCVNSGTIDDATTIKTMLTGDEEFQKMAKNMVHVLREKRLKSKTR